MGTAANSGSAPTSVLLQHAVAERVRAHDGPDRRVFDRLTSLVSTLLGAPVSLLLIADDDKLLFASFVGPDDPWGTLTEFPLKDAYCQFAVGARAPFVVEDARKDPRVRDLPHTTTLAVAAYLGVPLLTSAGDPIGILCALDFEPRSWSEQDVSLVQDLANAVMSYLEARPIAAETTTTGLNIAAVSFRTGIGADTLRKWERRYGVLRPRRTAGGQRRYDERDVARVEWLRDRLAEGFRIGEAAALLEGGATSSESSPEGLRDAVVAAAADTDARLLATLVEQAFTLHDVEIAIEEIVAPALRTIGDGWRTGAESIAQEHMLTEIVQSRLRRLLDGRRHAVRGTAVLACAAGERHELGLLALGVLLQADGWLAVYLGADTPLDAALAAAAGADADLLCLSATTTDRFEQLDAELSQLDLPEGLRVLTGGPARTGVPPHRLGDAVTGLRVASSTPRA